MDFLYYIVYPFSWLLNIFYHAVDNYGLAIIFFAIVVKIVLFPLTLKGKKGMIQMNMLSGKLEQLKKKYGKDQQRYNLEMQKLYEREHVNPMSGCLWSLLPLLILLPLYAIIRQPLKYLMGLTPDQIQQVAQALNWNEVALDRGWIRQAADTFTNGGYNQLYLASLIQESGVLGGVNVFPLNFRFLGIDLAAMPTWRIWENPSWSVIGAFLMVMISTALSFFMSTVSNKTNQISGQTQNGQAARTNRTMMWVMSLMSLWIGFTMPAALCVYWIANSLLTMLQELVAARMLRKEYAAARAAAEERARQDKEEERQRKEQARLERERQAEEEKKNKKKSGTKSSQSAETDINKDDSREGLRAHARGRAYRPDRFGSVTEYVDPNLLKADPKAKPAEKPVTEKMDLTGLAEKKTTSGADSAQDGENKESD